MYPTISHLLKDLFGIDIPLPIATFGFFLIIAIYTAGWVLGKELKRRRALGQFSGHEETFVENAPPTTNEILLACLWSFLIGYKFVEAFAHYGDLLLIHKSLFYHREEALVVALFLLSLPVSRVSWQHRN